MNKLIERLKNGIITENPIFARSISYVSNLSGYNKSENA